MMLRTRTAVPEGSVTGVSFIGWGLCGVGDWLIATPAAKCMLAMLTVARTSGPCIASVLLYSRWLSDAKSQLRANQQERAKRAVLRSPVCSNARDRGGESPAEAQALLSTHALAHHLIGFDDVADGVWSIYFGRCC